MPDEAHISLSRVRMEHAWECLKDAQENLNNEQYKNAANRSCYAAFHAMRAVLALDGVDFKRHAGVLSEFQKNYIKTKVFPVSFSRYITDLFNVRTKSDYDDFFILPKADVVNQVSHADEMLHGIEKYLAGIWNGEN